MEDCMDKVIMVLDDLDDEKREMECDKLLNHWAWSMNPSMDGVCCGRHQENAEGS